MSKRLLERRPLRVLFVLLYTIVGALLILEIVLRIFDPIGIVYYFDTARYFKAMKPDADFGYIHTPGYRARLQDVDIAINGEGLRGPPFDLAKPEGEKRLMILGDSVVFGWGAPQDSIFPALLQIRLTERDESWRVIAAGVGSWNTRAEYEWLQKRGVDYGIDALLLVAVANDVEVSAAGSKIVTPDEPVEAQRVSIAHRVVRGLAKYSYAVGTFYHVLKQRNTSTTLTDLYRPGSAAWRDARSALDGIVLVCRELEIPLVAFLYSDFKTDFSKAFLSAYRGHLEGHGVPVHVFAEEVYDKRYRNSIVDGHANPAAHRLIADELYRALPLP